MIVNSYPDQLPQYNRTLSLYDRSIFIRVRESDSVGDNVWYVVVICICAVNQEIMLYSAPEYTVTLRLYESL